MSLVADTDARARRGPNRRIHSPTYWSFWMEMGATFPRKFRGRLPNPRPARTREHARVATICRTTLRRPNSPPLWRELHGHGPHAGDLPRGSRADADDRDDVRLESGNEDQD